MNYKLFLTQAVFDFLKSLDKVTFKAVDHYLSLIVRRFIEGDFVRPASMGIQKVRVPASECDATLWPVGLRILYTVREGKMSIYCLDMGDHSDSASKRGQSVYQNERPLKVS